MVLSHTLSPFGKKRENLFSQIAGAGVPVGRPAFCCFQLPRFNSRYKFKRNYKTGGLRRPAQAISIISASALRTLSS